MENNTNLEHKRHTLAHLLARAVLELYPDAKNTIGPATDTGFYYDFEFTTPLSDKDLKKIAKKMRQVLPTWQAFTHEEVDEKKALDLYSDNKYKQELIKEIAGRGEPITLYTVGDFTDLCRGGHDDNPAENIASDSFTLDRVAGAYWRGDEKNTMLTRIYGLAFETKDELDKFLNRREDAKDRDHRKLGKELDLFTFSDLVGSGLPLFTPNGTLIRNALQNSLLEISEKYGMQPVCIPHIAKKELYETSGHAQKFGDELIKVISHYDEFVMKPVNCPHHTQIYASQPRSYRDLPVRYMESTMQYRDEKPGEIGGLTRVRSITVDDGHIFCTVDQIKDEAKNISKIIEKFYTDLGIFGNHWVSLSVRDPNKLDDYIGEDKDWNKAEKMLSEISDDLNLNAKTVEGEAAIYGPKLDYMFKDSLDREWQLATIQIDFAMPKRFKLEYTAEDGTKKSPVMIHRAILGSYERFMAILIEHFAGAFPLWLSPTQVAIVPISEDHEDFAQEVAEKLKNENIRTKYYESGNSLGKRIRDIKQNKTPYFIVVGDKEKESGNLTIENRAGEKFELSTEDLIKKIIEEVKNKK